MTNERRVDDELLETHVICILEMIISHHGEAHEPNERFMVDIVTT